MNELVVRVGRAACLFVGAALVAARADATPIVTFDFNDLNGTAASTATHLTWTAIEPGAGLLPSTFANGDATARRFHGADAADALSNLDYWSFTISAQSGWQFDITDIYLDEAGNVRGPTEFQLWIGGALVSSATTTSLFPTGHVFSLAGLDDLTSAEIRILAWGSDNGNNDERNWSVDNVRVDGTVEPFTAALRETAVISTPEPGSLLLLGSGLSALAMRVRRLRQKRNSPV